MTTPVQHRPREAPLRHLRTTLSLEGQRRTRNAFEHIFARYGRDLSGVADEIDLVTGQVVVDNGDLRQRVPQEIHSAWTEPGRGLEDDESYEDSDDDLAQQSEAGSSFGAQSPPAQDGDDNDGDYDDDGHTHAHEFPSNTGRDSNEIFALPQAPAGSTAGTELPTLPSTATELLGFTPQVPLDLQDPQSLQEFILSSITKGIQMGFESLRSNLGGSTPAAPMPPPRSIERQPSMFGSNLYQLGPQRRPGLYQEGSGSSAARQAEIISGTGGPRCSPTTPSNSGFAASNTFNSQCQPGYTPVFHKSTPQSSQYKFMTTQFVHFRTPRSLHPHLKWDRFTAEDDAKLTQLKLEGLSWDDIYDEFPEQQSINVLKNRWYKVLQHRPEVKKMLKQDTSRSINPHILEDIHHVRWSSGNTEVATSAKKDGNNDNNINNDQDQRSERQLSPSSNDGDRANEQEYDTFDNDDDSGKIHSDNIEVKRSTTNDSLVIANLRDVPFADPVSSPEPIREPSSETPLNEPSFVDLSSDRDDSSTPPLQPKRKRELSVQRRLSWSARKRTRLENRAATRRLLRRRSSTESIDDLAL